MSNTLVHQVITRYQAAWDEWRPECSCGWVGSYLLTAQAARDEGLTHVARQRAEEHQP